MYHSCISLAVICLCREGNLLLSAVCTGLFCAIISVLLFVKLLEVFVIFIPTYMKSSLNKKRTLEEENKSLKSWRNSARLAASNSARSK